MHSTPYIEAGTADRTAHARRNMIVLVLAQAVLGSQLPMITVLAGLAGQTLADDICWATLPITMQGIGAMASSLWLSRLMKRYGRKTGFLLGILCGSLGAGISALGLLKASFPLFLAGSFITGIYASAQGFYRFAAMDSVTERNRPKAMSLVMSGGLVAAIIGTQLTKVTTDAMVIPFLGTYVAVIFINLIGFILFAFLKIGNQPSKTEYQIRGRSNAQLLTDPKVLRAIFCGVASYGLMLLVMTAAPLAIVGVGCARAVAADVVMAHVLAMFIPSFFTGHLISRFGAEVIVSIGLLLLTAAGLANLSGIEILNFFSGLILLGLGWNFGFIGATAMLSKTHTKGEQGQVQGLNDMLVFGATTAASLASGTLMNCSGRSVIEGWTTVNLAMIPFLALAALLLLAPTLAGLKANPRTFLSLLSLTGWKSHLERS